ncbi:MAG: iron-sulfur cluster assembly scaffold protein [Verrucomicrobiaceae bacterium]
MGAASFQSFGCQTAIAVASIATELIRGKTKEEALAMKADDLSRPSCAAADEDPLRPMVEGALKAALEAEAAEKKATPLEAPSQAGTLADAWSAAGKTAGKVKIVMQPLYRSQLSTKNKEPRTSSAHVRSHRHQEICLPGLRCWRRCGPPRKRRWCALTAAPFRLRN